MRAGVGGRGNTHRGTKASKSETRKLGTTVACEAGLLHSAKLQPMHQNRCEGLLVRTCQPKTLPLVSRSLA